MLKTGQRDVRRQKPEEQGLRRRGERPLPGEPPGVERLQGRGVDGGEEDEGEDDVDRRPARAISRLVDRLLGVFSSFATPPIGRSRISRTGMWNARATRL